MANIKHTNTSFEIDAEIKATGVKVNGNDVFHSGNLSTATTSANGLISKEDKAKLDTIATGATNYSHPDTHPATMIVEDSTHKFVTDTEKTTWNNKAEVSYVDSKVASVVNSAPAILDTLNELSTALGNDPNFATTVATNIGLKANSADVYTKTANDSLLANKVDKITGKGLSTEDYTTAEKNKLSGIEAGANAYVHPSTHTATMITEDATHRFMTDTERTKLSGIEANANNYTHPANHSPSIITQDANNRFVTDSQISNWNGKASTALATTGNDGLMSSTDKVKLMGISNAANYVEGSVTNGNIKINNVETTVYTHPANHTASIITQDSNNRFVTDAEKTTWNGKLDKTGGTLTGLLTTGSYIYDSNSASNVPKLVFNTPGDNFLHLYVGASNQFDIGLQTTSNTIPSTSLFSLNVTDATFATNLQAKSLMTDNTLEKTFTKTFTDNATTPNQKIDLYWTGDSLGTIEVEITGGFNVGNATGKILKKFSFYGSNTGTVYNNTVEGTEVFGTINQYFGISDISWDATNSRWKVTIAQRSGSNSIIICVKILSGTTFLSSWKTLAISNIYTTDSTDISNYTGLYNNGQFISTGKVGIGTTNALGSLHVKNPSAAATTLYLDAQNGGNENAQITFSNASTNSLDIKTSYVSTENKITLTPGGTTAMTLRGNGNVAIGIAANAAKFAVSDGITVGYIHPSSTGVEFGTYTNHDLGLYTNNTKRVIINTSGNIGIGKLTLSAWNAGLTALHIGGTATVNAETTAGSGNLFDIGNNVYTSSGGQGKTIVAGQSTLYRQASGTHTFYSSPTNTTDAVISNWTTSLAINEIRAQFNVPIYNNATKSDNAFNGGIAFSTTNSANLAGTSAMWALRTDTNNNFNLDVYNSGTPKAALKIVQDGSATFTNSVTATVFNGNLAGNAGTANALNVHSSNEINIGGSYSGGGDLYINYNDGGSINGYRFHNGGTALAQVTASQFNGNLAGNATTATTLQTARNINGVAFNGSQDITLPNATPTVAGLMSAADKTKLDGLGGGYVHPSSHPSTMITTTTTNFNGILTSSETNLQLALDKIDDHTHNTFSGNVAIGSGITENWQTEYKVLKFGTHSALCAGNYGTGYSPTSMFIYHNAYKGTDSAAHYSSDYYAAAYCINDSNHSFLCANSGTKDSSITWKYGLTINSTTAGASDCFVGINGTNASTYLDIFGNNFRLRNSKTPASATDTGNQGQICWDTNYLYVCVASNTWKRTALVSW